MTIFYDSFFDELEKIALNRGAKDLVRLAIKEFPEIIGLSKIREPVKILSKLLGKGHEPSKELVQLAEKYTKSPTPFTSNAMAVHNNRRTGLLSKIFGKIGPSEHIQKAVSGRHIAGKDEISVPATFFEGIAKQNRKRSPFVFRGNPFEEGQAFLTTRHPGSAAGYAMGDYAASNAREKVTNRLFALRRKGLKGIETIQDQYGGSPIDAIRNPKLLRQDLMTSPYRNNRTTEMVVNPKAKTQVVGEYTVRRSRIGNEPAYAIKPIGNSRLDIFKE